MSQLPKWWEEKKLQDVSVEFGRGKSKHRPRNDPKLYGGKYPFVQTGDVRNSNHNITTYSQTYNETGLAQSKLWIKGTICITIAANIAETGILGFDACFPDSVIGIVVDERQTSNTYVEFLLQAMKARIQAKGKGSAQGNINLGTFQNEYFPFPPLPEQKRIVSILDEAFVGIDQAIANTEKNLANARELFESYLNNVFTQKGEGWEEKKVGELCHIKHGFAFKSKFFTQDGEYVVLTPGSFYESGGFRDQGGKTKYYEGEIPDGFILEKGAFLIAMTEQAVGLLGSSLIVPESNRFLHNQRLGLVELKDGVSWDNDFFHHQLNTKFFRDAVQSTASGVKVRHTSPKKMYDIPIYYPVDIKKQKQVASQINELKMNVSKATTLFQQKLNSLRELKQSILQKAFTGELTADYINEQVN